MSTQPSPSAGDVVLLDLVEDPVTEPTTLDDIAMAPAAPPTFVAEVVAGESAQRPGRVHCGWSQQGVRREAWLPITRGVAPRRYDRVLCVVADGAPEPIVTAIIDGLAGGLPRPAASSPRLRLDADEALCIASADGTPLLEVRAAEGRVVVSVLQHETEIALARPLRLRAPEVRIEATEGNVEVVANGDAVVQGETIQLN